ncbi:hypothetical protein CXB49_16140 [Chromobacterium sp. ATCC 53434]|uniref:hypothetical protein n=1 Tax=Chromobacterium sp. (strain ATCC 53434 / SC 14030) TaxID=2059672 RepID=UPI000C771398|nr:hypothetical protein [Chromobacterium sp. ATCC 53434]AUH53660.1 hypothetical protein CXB49_16140 [Chromobacterium sp. ATCC 53434]
MVFDNIFSTAQTASQSGTIAEAGISGYIPSTPAESITVPPHDPSQPFTPGPQDPKIVRETSPQALLVFNLIGSLTQTMGQAAGQQNAIFNDPSTTLDTAAPIVSQGDPITSKYPGTVQQPPIPTQPA